MKIKTIIYLSLFVLAIALIIFTAVTYISYRDVTIASQKHAKANVIAKDVTEIRVFSFEYVLNPEERSRVQWEISYRDLSKTLADYPQNTPEENPLISDILKRQIKLQSIFSKLNTIIKENTSNTQSDPNLQEAQNRLVGEILTQSQGLVTDSLKLLDVTYKETVITQTMANSFVVLITVILFFICFAMFLLFRKRILSPLSRLEEATHIISQGNLDYVVKISGNDEIGSLAKSFNDMTAKLKNLDSMKSEFLKIAAHQLRTPLGIIRWNLESILGAKSLSHEKQKQILNETYNTLLKLISLIGELIVVYRIDQEKSSKPLYPVFVKENIIKNINKVKEVAKNKKIKITSKLKISDSLKIKINTEKLDTILQNVLSNSLLYSKNADGEINIEVIENKKTISIIIRDNGIGIPEKQMSNLFSRFFRAPNAMLKEPNGNGLGLYVVKSYVEEIGGKVVLSSKENEGTTVTITLPKNI